MHKRKIKCDYEDCGRSYCSYFNLKRHLESSHMGIRKFKCPICARFLSSKQNYVDHQNIHTGAKPYLCEYPRCSMRFRQLSQYYLHKQLHSDVALHSMKPENDNQGILAVLGKKLSEEPLRLYNIPLLPYSVENAQLPLIVKTQEFSLPLSSVLASGEVN